MIQVNAATHNWAFACVMSPLVLRIVALAKCVTHSACVSVHRTVMGFVAQVRFVIQQPVLANANRIVAALVRPALIAIRIPVLVNVRRIVVEPV